jgi:hypothetical protein
MNRHEYAALARGTGAVTLGLLPFAALGYFGSWWLTGGLFAAGVGAAGVWLTRFPEGPRP